MSGRTVTDPDQDEEGVRKAREENGGKAVEEDDWAKGRWIGSARSSSSHRLTSSISGSKGFGLGFATLHKGGGVQLVVVVIVAVTSESYGPLNTEVLLGAAVVLPLLVGGGRNETRPSGEEGWCELKRSSSSFISSSSAAGFELRASGLEFKVLNSVPRL